MEQYSLKNLNSLNRYSLKILQHFLQFPAIKFWGVMH